MTAEPKYLEADDRQVKQPPRSRWLTAALILLTIALALGLASRRFADALPEVIAAYAGDALWAAMVYWIAAFLSPRARTRTLAAIALATATLVELSQLYHAPWIDVIRTTRFGALALGHGFLWSDLVCYAFGVAVTAFIDFMLRRAIWDAESCNQN